MDRLNFPIELKLAATETGVIEGYASVFGVVDSHRDVVVPGAFVATLKNRKAAGRPLPPMLMQHGFQDPKPVGVWTSIEEDAKGLRVKGQLVGLKTDIGRFNLALVQEGALRGLSIGFSVPAGGASFEKRGDGARRTLKAVDLWEISLVDQPSNPESVITDAKGVRSARDLEQLLRKAGFPNAAAKKLTAGGWPALNPQPQQPQHKALLERIQAARAAMKGEK